MKLGAWLLAMVQPLVGRILLALGFEVVTITGLSAIVGQLKEQTVSGLSMLGPEMLNLFLLSGGATGLGIILGALATKLMLWQIQSATKILAANPT